jgi:hypothetical protein
MKEKNIQIKKYICDVCGHEHNTPQEAGDCERSHYIYKVGNAVWFDDGSYHSEQGSMYPMYYSDYKLGTVIEVKPNYCLVETSDGERHWKRNFSLYHENPEEVIARKKDEFYKGNDTFIGICSTTSGYGEID